MGLQVMLVIALHTQYRLNTQDSIQIRVLAAGLLSPSPAGVTEDIHIRAPECQLWIPRIINLSHRHMEDVMITAVPVGTSLIGDRREHLIYQLVIKRRCHPNGLRKDSIAILTDTMTCLTPPVIRRNTETVDRCRLVHHQPHLLLRCQQGYQVLHPLLIRE